MTLGLYAMCTPLPLFRPGRELDCVDQLQWAFQAKTIVAESHRPNYQSACITVQTDLKINNWRVLCANFEDQLLLEYLEYGFPLCINKQALTYNPNVVHQPFNSLRTLIHTLRKK